MAEVTMSFTEIILILLSVGGFGVSPNPAAPPAAEVLRYAPDDAELVASLDVEAVAPANWQALERLPEAPAIKASRPASDALAHMIDEARAARAQAKAELGFDVVTDLRSATVFVTPHGGGEPDFLVVLRGRFPADTVERLGAKVGGTRVQVGGQPVVTSPDGKQALGLAADGSLLGGKASWVRERLSGYTPRRSRLGDASAAGLEGKPFFFAAARPSAMTLLSAAKDVNDPLARDLFGNLEDATLALYSNGVGATFTSRTASGYARGVLAVEGVVELLRAGHHYVRGFGRLGAAVLDSYATSSELQAFVAHKADLLRLLDSSTGDGAFQAVYDRKEQDRKLSVRLTGKTIGEVLPAAGMIVPIGMGALLAARSAAHGAGLGAPDHAPSAPPPGAKQPVKKPR